MVASRFLLKTAPPKLGRSLPVRPRLERRWSDIRDRTAIVVTAPQGFGKTTLLAQWRKRWLERGTLAAWVTLDALDERAQFTELLGFALRSATGREAFAVATMQGRHQQNRELDALTMLLAEVSALATPTLVVLDDAHRMPQGAIRELLPYLLNNAPANLQFLIGTRRPLELQFADLMARGELAGVDAADLRLDADETCEFLRARFGPAVGLDEAARLHSLTEGWPLGLQLAAAAIERARDRRAAIAELSAQRGDIQRFFFETLLSRLAPAEASFFVHTSILESMNADLAKVVSGFPGAPQLLEAASLESPIVTRIEGRDWIRLHSMARDFLLGQFDKLPVGERSACYERAAAWYAANGYFQEAAHHAWAAGSETVAVAYASRCLLDIGREGRMSEARDWLRRIPASAVARDVGLQLTAAWIRALGDSPDSVPAEIERIRNRTDLDDDSRFVASLVMAAADIFLDRAGLVPRELSEWSVPPASAAPLHVLAFANSRALLALHSGDTARVRELLAEWTSADEPDPSMRLPRAFADLIVGLSHLWEGDPARTAALLQPRLAATERVMGRRSVLAAMFAGVLAMACVLRGESDEGLALLADRLDVIERAGMPDPIVLAYRAVAEVAMQRDDERRAMDALEALRSVGVARRMPRLVVASLLGQVRIHVQRGRVETATEVLALVRELRPTFEQDAYRPFLPLLDRRLAAATAQVSLSRGEAAAAEATLEAVSKAPSHLARHPDVLIVRALRALAAHQLGRPNAREMLSEALSLADVGGFRWIVEQAHPAMASFLELVANGRCSAAPQRPAREGLIGANGVAVPRTPAAASGLLTPKESRILLLLASGLANKEIARSMDIGEQTVKWHLKNLFFKLNAASRRHAVDRARLLGLISG